MSDRIVASVPPAWMFVVPTAFLAAVLGAVIAAFTGPVGAIFGLVLTIGSAFGMAWLTRARLVVDHAGIRYTSGLRSTELPWSAVAGLAITEVSGARTWWYEILLRDGGAMRFTSNWAEGDRVAAMIQRRRFDPEAELDRRGPVVFDPLTEETTARPDPTETLGAAPEVLNRWLDRVEQELAFLEGRLDRRQLQLVADDGIVELFALGRRCMAVDEDGWDALVAEHASELRGAQSA